MPAIGVDSLGLRMTAVRKLADRARYEARQVAYDESHNEPGRKPLVMRLCE